MTAAMKRHPRLRPSKAYLRPALGDPALRGLLEGSGLGALGDFLLAQPDPARPSAGVDFAALDGEQFSDFLHKLVRMDDPAAWDAWAAATPSFLATLRKAGAGRRPLFDMVNLCCAALLRHVLAAYAGHAWLKQGLSELQETAHVFAMHRLNLESLVLLLECYAPDGPAGPLPQAVHDRLLQTAVDHGEVDTLERLVWGGMQQPVGSGAIRVSWRSAL
jgi:hypothetical protein